MQKLPEIGEEFSKSGSNVNSRDVARSKDAPEPSALPQLTGPLPGFKGRMKKSGHSPERYGSHDRQKLQLMLDKRLPLIFNPDPLPYEAQYFKAATLKTYTSQKRHHDAHPLNRLTKLMKIQNINPDDDPRHRRNSEQDDQVMERLRMAQQEAAARRKTVGGRPADFVMGGTKALLQERKSVHDEVQKLKNIVLPLAAREMYIGKFEFPKSHRLMQEKPKELSEYASEAEPQELSEEPQKRRRSMKRETSQIVPPIEKSPSFLISKPLRAKTMFSLKSIRKVNEDSAEGMRPPINVLREAVPEVHEPSRSPTPEPTQSVPSSRPSSASMEFVRVEDEEVHIPQEHSRTPSVTPNPPKAPTPNPFQNVSMEHFLSDEEKERWLQLFRKNDFNQDGHLTWPEVVQCLPRKTTAAELKFFKLVYDLTSQATYFGEKEFISLVCLDMLMEKHSPIVKDSYEQTIKVLDITTITSYLDRFDRRCRYRPDIASLDDFRALLEEWSVPSNHFSRIIAELDLHRNDYVTKLQFLAAIPHLEAILHPS